MSLELKINGDAAGIRRVAEWLDPSLSQAAINLDLELAYLTGDLIYMWTGESGLAFNSAANEARRTTMAVPTLARDLAEVMRAYAGRLERGQEKFDRIASKAREAGLKVVGRYVHYPTSWLKYCPGPDSPQAEKDEYEAYCKRLDKYNQLSEEVGTWEGELEVWIYEHFGGLMGQVVDVAEASRVLEALVQHNPLVVSTALELADYRNDINLEAWRKHAQDSQQAWEDYKKNSRSGNPRKAAAAKRAVPADLKAAIRHSDDVVKGLARNARIIPGIGWVVDIGLAGVDVSQGGSASSNAAGLLGGAGAAAIAGATVSGPVGWVVGAAVVAGWAGGEAGTWLWEETVPLDVRESIDAWFMGAVDVVIFWD